MKKTGDSTYTGVQLKELNKFFKDDAVIQVSKKFLNLHKLVSAAEHVRIEVSKEQEQPKEEVKMVVEKTEEKTEEKVDCNTLW